MTACSPADLNTDRMPALPAGAQMSTEEGAQEQRLDEVVIQIREALQEDRRPLDIVTYRLPVGADWAAVSAHYARALTWPRDMRLADHLRGAQARAWRKDGHVFAVALIETPVPGQPTTQPLLVVANAE